MHTHTTPRFCISNSTHCAYILVSPDSNSTSSFLQTPAQPALQSLTSLTYSSLPLPLPQSPPLPPSPVPSFPHSHSAPKLLPHRSRLERRRCALREIWHTYPHNAMLLHLQYNTPYQHHCFLRSTCAPTVDVALVILPVATAVISSFSFISRLTHSVR